MVIISEGALAYEMADAWRQADELAREAEANVLAAQEYYRYVGRAEAVARLAARFGVADAVACEAEKIYEAAVEVMA